MKRVAITECFCSKKNLQKRDSALDSPRKRAKGTLAGLFSLLASSDSLFFVASEEALRAPHCDREIARS